MNPGSHCEPGFFVFLHTDFWDFACWALGFFAYGFLGVFCGWASYFYGLELGGGCKTEGAGVLP